MISVLKFSLSLHHQGMAKPELLHEEFTCYEYLKRVTRSDIGKPILYRGPFMAGW